MRTPSLLALLVAAPALAQDDGEINLGDIDISLDDLDLDGSGGSGTLTYTGAITERKQDLGANIPITISHTRGPITVNCTDDDSLSARIDYVIEGTDKARMEALGKSVGLAVWGDAASGGAKVRMNTPGTGVSRVDAPLVVTAPKAARLRVTGGDAGVSVTNCALDVEVSAAGGVYVEGSFQGFKVSSSKGAVKIELEDGATITKASQASAPAGDLTLILPENPSNQLNASGREVSVAPLVTGTNTPTKVAGELGNGGAMITLSAPKGTVRLETR